jgi:MFS family permease
MLNFLDKAVIGLAGHQIIEEFDISPTTFGLINAFFFAFFIPASAIGGYLIDRFRSKTVLSVMVCIWGIAMLPMLLPLGVAFLFASRMLLGAGEGPTAAVTTHIVFRWFDEERRVLAFAIFSTAPWVAVAFGAPVLTQVIEGAGWRVAFFILGALSFVWLAVWMWLGKESPLELREPGRRAVIKPVAMSEYRRAILSRTFMGTLAVVFAQYMVLSTVTAWLPLFLTDGHRIPPVTASWIVAGQWALFATMPILVAFISRRLIKQGKTAKQARGNLAALILIMSGVIATAATQLATGPLQIGCIMFAFGMMPAVLPLMFTTVSNIVPEEQRGFVLGIWSAGLTTGGIISPLLIGIAVSSSSTSSLDGYLTGFMIVSVIMVVGGLLGWLLISPESDRARIMGGAIA